MCEKLKPFEHGVKIEETCANGMRGIITLKKPLLMGKKAFYKYASVSSDACLSCKFREKQLCFSLDYNGEAWAETIGRKLIRELNKNKAPCVQNKVEISTRVQNKVEVSLH